MSVQSEQYFTTEKPSFIWKATIKLALLIHIIRRDKYWNGKGSMLIKFLSLFTVANSKGKEINQGYYLVRYLNKKLRLLNLSLKDMENWIKSLD